jgi:hypothetical protein
MQYFNIQEMKVTSANLSFSGTFLFQQFIAKSLGWDQKKNIKDSLGNRKFSDVLIFESAKVQD